MGVRDLGSALASTARARAEARPDVRSADAEVGRLRVSWTLLVVVGLAAVGTFALAPSIGLLVEQRQTIAALQAQVAEQEASVDELGDRIAQWDDPAYVEAQARDRLYYVHPGETAYVVLDDRGPAESAEEVERFDDQLVATRGDWVRSSVDSFVLAGLTDASPEALLGIEGGGDEGAP